MDSSTPINKSASNISDLPHNGTHSQTCYVSCKALPESITSSDHIYAETRTNHGIDQNSADGNLHIETDYGINLHIKLTMELLLCKRLYMTIVHIILQKT